MTLRRQQAYSHTLSVSTSTIFRECIDKNDFIARFVASKHGNAKNNTTLKAFVEWRLGVHHDEKKPGDASIHLKNFITLIVQALHNPAVEGDMPIVGTGDDSFTRSSGQVFHTMAIRAPTVAEKSGPQGFPLVLEYVLSQKVSSCHLQAINWCPKDDDTETVKKRYEDFHSVIKVINDEGGVTCGPYKQKITSYETADKKETVDFAKAAQWNSEFPDNYSNACQAERSCVRPLCSMCRESDRRGLQGAGLVCRHRPILSRNAPAPTVIVPAADANGEATVVTFTEPTYPSLKYGSDTDKKTWLLANNLVQVLKNCTVAAYGARFEAWYTTERVVLFAKDRTASNFILNATERHLDINLSFRGVSISGDISVKRRILIEILEKEDARQFAKRHANDGVIDGTLIPMCVLHMLLRLVEVIPERIISACVLDRTDINAKEKRKILSNLNHHVDKNILNRKHSVKNALFIQVDKSDKNVGEVTKKVLDYFLAITYLISVLRYR
jgi:hypothetical protein